MSAKTINRRTMLKGVGSISIGLPLLEEMIQPAIAAAKDDVPIRAFNIFFGLGIPAPLQAEGFDDVLEPLKPLAENLLIMRNVNQIRCDESGINAHYDGFDHLIGYDFALTYLAVFFIFRFAHYN